MSTLHRWRTMAAGCVAAWALIACGGGSGSSSDNGGSSGVTPPPSGGSPSEPGAPSLTGNIALDGRNWINFRRAQAGMPELAHNTVIDGVALGHSEYQRINNTVTHEQTPGNQGFTGRTLLDRFTAGGYVFSNTGHAYGEVISATTNNSGFYMAEELITAIYHRFVIFEPIFKELGTGSATTSAGYTYFTTDFASNNGYGAGIGQGNLAPWPFNGQTQVPTNFFSDNEMPDPVPNQNEVGYPISIHANLTSSFSVTGFSVRPRGGAALAVKVLTGPADPETPLSAAAIIPLSPLASKTTYDVSFSGSVDGTQVSRNWSFTTK